MGREELNKMSAKNIESFDKFRQYVMMNRMNSYTVRSFSLETQGYHRWVGGQSWNNRIYGIPNHEKAILKYNLNDNKENLIGELSTKTYKWTGGVIYGNTLYGFPRSSDHLLSLSIENEDIEEIPLGFIYEGEHHYGGVCSLGGIVYQPPRNSDHILCIDLKRKTCKKIHVEGLNGNSRYCGSIIHPNGYAYFLPERNEKVIRMDLDTEKTSFIGNEISPMCFDAKVAVDGNIYGYSAYSMGIVKIDVWKETCEMIQRDTYFGSYGTKMGVNGKLYSVPGDGQYVWEYDPLDNRISKIKVLDRQIKSKFAGGLTDNRGRIYTIPVDSDMILEYRPEEECEAIPDDIFRTFFCDCY